ncbi:MAG: diguanylate cyclase, partial [Chloroflexota bacterium]
MSGALPRAALQERLDYEVKRAVRLGVPLALCIVDLDYFKSINDAFGHRRGDQVLEGFTARTQTCLRQADSLFRYGGDEFVLLLPDTDRTGAQILLERLVDAVATDPFPGDPPISLTLSIGASLLPADAANAEDLFEEADRRLYEAKRQGRAGMVIEPAPSLRSPDLIAPSRLIERDQALATLNQFLGTLPHQRRAVPAISGPRGAGHTRFLKEAIHAAGRQSFATLTLRARPALRTRLFGALAEAEGSALDIESAQNGVEAAREALRCRVTAEGRRGVVIAVESLLDLDGACFDLLTGLLDFPEHGGPPIGLICTTGSLAPERVRALEPASTTTVELAPFTYRGTVLWLRGALAWDIPEEFAHWLHEQTEGLPAPLARITRYLIEDRRISPDQRGRRMQPESAMAPLPANLRARKPPPLAMPNFPTAFVGRIAEIQSVKQLIEAGSLVSVIGPGGVGKTRLAVQAAAEVHERFPAGVCFVPLASVAAAVDLAPAIGGRLGVTPEGRQSAESALLAFLHDKELLLILDNLEHLRDGVGLLATLRERAPSVTLLITSREPLYLPNEVTVSLSGLQVAHKADDKPALSSAAMQLFMRRIQDAQPGFIPDEDDLEAAARICAMVEGLPLAIELAAAWVGSLGCAAVATAIERNLDFLSEESETGDSARSARAVLDYFWSTLSIHEQIVLQ